MGVPSDRLSFLSDLPIMLRPEFLTRIVMIEKLQTSHFAQVARKPVVIRSFLFLVVCFFGFRFMVSNPIYVQSAMDRGDEVAIEISEATVSVLEALDNVTIFQPVIVYYQVDGEILKKIEQQPDVIAAAYQLGRLDYVGLALTAFGAVLTGVGLVVFIGASKKATSDANRKVDELLSEKWDEVIREAAVTAQGTVSNEVESYMKGEEHLSALVRKIRLTEDRDKENKAKAQSYADQIDDSDLVDSGAKAEGDGHE